MVKVGTSYTFVSLDGTPRMERKTFKEAFTDMFKWVDDLLQKGQMSYQVLETAIWIEVTSGQPIMFYDARDLACEMGILKDGKLVE